LDEKIKLKEEQEEFKVHLVHVMSQLKAVLLVCSNINRMDFILTGRVESNARGCTMEAFAR
jgi:hypothetical protein